LRKREREREREEPSPAMAGRKVMEPDTLNENVKKTVYAVRGELYLRASELQKEGKKVG
jgi:glutamate--glyoxylate aminotransferase